MGIFRQQKLTNATEVRACCFVGGGPVGKYLTVRPRFYMKDLWQLPLRHSFAVKFKFPVFAAQTLILLTDNAGGYYFQLSQASFQYMMSEATRHLLGFHDWKTYCSFQGLKIDYCLLFHGTDEDGLVTKHTQLPSQAEKNVCLFFNLWVARRLFNEGRT